MAKGAAPQTPTQTTTYNPSPQEQELVNLAMPGIRNFAATPLTRYQGDTVADFTQPQQQGQQMALNAASGAQQGTADRASQTSNFWLGGDTWNPQTNQMLGSAIQAAQRPLYQNLTEQVLPNIRSEFGAGGFGSSRQGIAEGLAVGRTQQAAGDVGAKMAEDLYKTNVGAQMQALGLVPTVQGAQVAPAMTTSAVGDVQQNLEQQRLNQAQQNYYLDRFLPFLQSQEILGLSQSVPRGRTVSTGSVPQPSKISSVLGGATTGATLGSAILPGIGTGVGALGGALLPFLF